MHATDAERRAMLRAFELAAQGPSYGPNPRVGCVILAPSDDGEILGEGRHLGSGTPHAEVDALAAVARGDRDPRGATAVVTLEPCTHQGRTGPCVDALVQAGIARVVIAVQDPNPRAMGGADRLRAAGIDVIEGVESELGEQLLRTWLAAMRLGRPFVTLKLALSLDGRVAAADGTSRWITSTESRAHAHAFRAEVDAILVGTSTALVDNPTLTARTADDALAEHQPLRVVLGLRSLPQDARLLHSKGGEVLALKTRSVSEALKTLAALEVRHVLVEGGPTIATAFLAAGVVDQVHGYTAPVLLGGGPHAVSDFGVATIDQAMRLSVTKQQSLGTDTFFEATVNRTSGTGLESRISVHDQREGGR